MSQRLLFALAVGLALLVGGLALFWQPQAQPTPMPQAATPAGGDFTLHSADGQVSLKDFRGKVVLLYFGYTYCPDICPTSLATTAAGLNLLRPDEVGRVAMIFVSVDPERDTPAHLKEYVAFFHSAMIGVTGSAAEVAALTRQYGAYYAKQKTGTAGGYVVDHSSETYVVGPDGRLLGRLAHAAPPEQVAAAIRKYLN